MKDIFFELRIKSSQIYDELLSLVFAFGVTCIEESNGEIIIRDEDDLSLIEFGICEYANQLFKSRGLKSDLIIMLTKKPNKDWIDEYKKGVAPIDLGKIYIHPSWHLPKNDKINIVIDPALAFGSGHHESTKSCLKKLIEITKTPCTALDVGCGSGILAITLAKLGATVDACDTDLLAVQSSIENAKNNNVSFNKIWQGSISKIEQQYDIVVANIVADVILILKNDLKNSVKVGGILVLSGILNRYENQILDAFCDFNLVERIQLNEWSTFVFNKI